MSAAPASRETKNAYSCDTPRSRGLRGSRWTATGSEAEGLATEEGRQKGRAPFRNTFSSSTAFGLHQGVLGFSVAPLWPAGDEVRVHRAQGATSVYTRLKPASICALGASPDACAAAPPARG